MASAQPARDVGHQRAGQRELVGARQFGGAVRVHQQQRAYDQAVREFREAIQIKPGMPDSLFSLGWTYGLMDNREEAVRYLNRFLEVAGPDVPDSIKSTARDQVARLGG